MGGVWRGSCAPPQKKMNFYPKKSGFWCILGLLFTFMPKLVRSGRPLNPPLTRGIVFYAMVATPVIAVVN